MRGGTIYSNTVKEQNYVVKLGYDKSPIYFYRLVCHYYLCLPETSAGCHAVEAVTQFLRELTGATCGSEVHLHGQ